MTQDLQLLLEKIQREGVDKATVEADKIMSDARAQADLIISKAQAESTRVKATAQQEAEAFERRAEETVRQAARDTILNVEKAVNALFDKLLLKEVNMVFNKTELVEDLVIATVRAYLAGSTEVNVTANAQLVELLRKKFQSETLAGVTLVIDEHIGSGFIIRLANGRIEHPFTGAAVADALAKQLRPRLAVLMTS